MAVTNGALLTGIRVLDLTNSRAELAGRLLADLGAEVLKIEPPDGVDSRRRAPFDERPGSDHRSLYWASVGIGKRSAVLDLTSQEARDTVRQLARRADILVESFDPGAMDAWGLGYDALAALNPRLIYVSVSAYGQHGPKANWPASDLTIEAASGRAGLQGDRDRPPIPVGYPQPSFHAGAQAAADAVIALNERELSGLGQHLDTSATEGMIWTLMNGPGFPANVGGNPPGSGDDRADSGPARRSGPFLGVSPCADGYVVVTSTSQRNFYAAIQKSILPGLREAGQLSDSLAAYDWDAWEQAREANTLTDEQIAVAGEAVLAFFAIKPKLELMEWAWTADVHLGPVNSTKDLLENPHFRERGFWQKVGDYTHPGLSVRSSHADLVIGAPAPALGQDQHLIAEWLATPVELPRTMKVGRAARDRSRAQASSSDRLGEAFAGLKIADFSWVAVGPLTGKAIADHGATVVRIESSTRVDFVRTLIPFKDGVPGINRSHYVNNLNTSKLGVALNFAHPEAKALARRLIDWADVVVENYTPGTMKRLGFDYETISKDRPDIIMISTCLLGQTGPWRSFAGYGPHGAGISGLHYLTGWPDRPPVGPNGPYSDVIAPRYSVSALAAAILERRRTGKGQHLDVSQVESAIHFIEPLVLDQTVNGRTAGAAGLDSPFASPNGTYPTAGTERYVALSVETPEQWHALCSIAPLDAFADPRFDDMEQRRAAKTEIDAAITAWTRTFDHRDLEARLIAAGVPASVVQRMTDLFEDPQLAERQYFQTLTHGEVGDIPYDGLMTRFSAKKTVLHKASPCVGEDTDYVMREILGLGDDEIVDLVMKEIFV